MKDDLVRMHNKTEELEAALDLKQSSFEALLAETQKTRVCFEIHVNKGIRLRKIY